MRTNVFRFGMSFLALAMLIFVALAGSPAAFAAAPGDVIVNEIMQNPSAVSDENGEWFEVYNTTGSAIDIDGWTIRDDGTDSHVINNGGPLVMPAGGFLVLGSNADFASNGGVTVDYSYGSGWFLSNSADEVILQDTSLTEIDRVEYDGGLAFPDPTGASMSLIDPALDNNVGANWCEASTPFGDGDLGTPGVANDCGTTPPAVNPGDVVVNEIIQNPSAVSDDDGEWFEVYNTTSADIDMNGWVIRDDGSDSHIIGSPLVVPAGGYAILASNGETGSNGGVDVDYEYGSGWFLSNSADEVILEDETGVEIDRVEYDGGPSFPDPTGASMSLIDPALDNNIGANWCEASTPFGDGDMGTPGAANDCDTTPPVVNPGDVVVNEIIQNPSAVSDGDGEWFELYNPTDSDIDINGWTIRDDDTDNHLIDNGGPLIIGPTSFLILGNNSNPATNGDVDVDYSYGSGWFLSNSADEVILEDTSLIEIDRVEYDGGPNFPDPNGASMSLIDPVLDNNVGANWCEASTPYGDGDFGTPGAWNDCPVEVPDLVINEIMNNPNTVFDSDGEWFEVYNTTSADIDIEGWTIRDNDSDSHAIANGGPLFVSAGGFLILGNNADFATNGGVVIAYQYSGFSLANGADEVILLDDAGVEINRVEYDGGPVFPDPTGASMSLIDPFLDNNVGDNWCTASTPFGAGDFGTPGDLNDCPLPPPPAGFCGDPATFIHEVQGPGLSSPIDGATGIVIEGVVVGDFQGSTGLGGFFVQEEDWDIDSDPATSEGVLVFDGSFGVDVSDGDVVRVQGDVAEFFDLTELNNVSSVQVCGTSGFASPAEVVLPVGDILDWEWVEGMSIHIPHNLFVTDNYNQGRFGEVDLSVNGRLDNPTNVVSPGSPAQTLQDLNNLRRIQLDDGSTEQNPLPLPPYIGLNDTLRVGDTIPALNGVLSYAFGNYEVHPTAPVDFNRANVRDALPPAVGGTVKVASFNVLNYFTTLDENGPVCGPNFDQGCRGADNAFEFTRQRDKLIDAIFKLDADVLGLIELENNESAAIQDLVSGLNALAGPGVYDFIDTGTIGDDAITVAFLYPPVTVSAIGPFAILDSAVDPTFIDSKNRPVLAQTFVENTTDARFTAAVNHLKSKGSPCDDIGDPDQGDGQGNCNLTRTSAATALSNWLATDPTGSGDPDFIIIGDLNAYAMEDPINAIKSAGYTDLIESDLGIGAYSYVFFGQSGYLDHALSSPDLTPQVTGTAIWHINADEPRALDYNDFNQPALYNPDPYRSSDHDPVIVGLDLNGPPVCDGAYPSMDTLWPVNHKFVAVDVLGISDPDGDAFSIIIDSIFQDEPVNGTGDGDTSPDGQGVGTSTAEVRAERDGGGNGRYYHIGFTASDEMGHSCNGEVLVGVPKSKKKPAIDDGPLFDSTVTP